MARRKNNITKEQLERKLEYARGDIYGRTFIGILLFLFVFLPVLVGGIWAVYDCEGGYAWEPPRDCGRWQPFIGGLAIIGWVGVVIGIAIVIILIGINF